MKKNIDFEEKKLKLEELNKENHEIIMQKVKIFNSFINELKIISFFKENRLYFKHPDYKNISLRGPILYKDKSYNELYVYDLEDRAVKKINMFDPQSNQESINLLKFFEIFDFDIAMRGLLSLEEHLIDSINENKKSNKEMKTSLEKYKEMLNK